MALLCHSERRLPEPRNQREAAAATVLEVETSDLNSEVAGGRRVMRGDVAYHNIRCRVCHSEQSQGISAKRSSVNARNQDDLFERRTLLTKSDYLRPRPRGASWSHSSNSVVNTIGEPFAGGQIAVDSIDGAVG